MRSSQAQCLCLLLGILAAVFVCAPRLWPSAAPDGARPSAARPYELAAAEAENSAKLSFTKTLKGSVPEFIQIIVDSNGDGTYEGRKLSDPPNPRPFKLSPSTAGQLFALAADLSNFQSIDLESHKRVANLGLKTLTYQQGGQVNRAEFNYTQNRSAQDLVDLFEGIASVEEHIINLEYDMKYDHLSLPRELLRIQIDLDNKALAEPELLVPTLKAITRNSRYLHLAQARAQDILERIGVNN